MLSLKNFNIIGIFTALVFSTSANAGLYGFDSKNPYTYEEEILNIDIPPEHIVNYREQMRNNINILAKYAKYKNDNFQIIVHGGEELLNKSLWEYHLEGYNEARRKGINANDPSFLFKLKQLSPEKEPIVGTSASYYIKNLDAIVLNNHFCAPQPINRIILEENIRLISIDSCQNGKAYDSALEKAIETNNLIYAFIKPEAAFKQILKQPIINENATNINNVKQAKNISFLIDDSAYDDKNKFIEDIRNSNYDIVVIEPLFHNKQAFTKDEINSLKFKKNGTRRQIIAKFNISEAKDGDYYWNNEWKIGNPTWLRRLSFVEKNGVITEYWHDDWKKIMGKHFRSIVDSDYDGAFLTGVENNHYFEKQTPLE